MNIGQRVWWWHTPTLRYHGTLVEGEDRPGVKPDNDPDVLYLDVDQIHTELPDGAHVDIPEASYHTDNSLSSSGARLLLPPSCPAKFRERMDNPPPPKPHFDFGHLVHALTLGKGAEVALVNADDWRSKAARDARDQAHAEGKIPALGDDYRKAALMRGAVREHPTAGPLLEEGDAEVSLFATDPETGVRLRARPDWMTRRDGRLWLIDLKTCADANPDTFDRTALKWSYHVQCVWYHTVARLLGLDESPAFLFVCVEKEPPYLVSVCELDADAFTLGAKQMRQAIDTFARCVETDTWPGYDDCIHPVSLPPWAFSDNQTTIGDLLQLEETA